MDPAVPAQELPLQLSRLPILPQLHSSSDMISFLISLLLNPAVLTTLSLAFLLILAIAFSDLLPIHQVAISILKLGPVPAHVAFVMDGNRRFAKQLNRPTTEGHYSGFIKLEETLNWSLELGIRVVTVYAFSIENFKRPKHEVDYLMELAKEKFHHFATKSEFIAKNEIAVRVLGDWSLLSPDVREAAAQVEHMTRNNKRFILNICFPYTSRHEMTHAIDQAVQGVSEGLLEPSDIDSGLLTRCLLTRDCPDLDIFVRTSGEIRFSDFLLWQTSGSCLIEFVNAFWPDFTFWHMLPILLSYQAEHPKLVVRTC
ncbi:putative undecaprenyl diphosphate synthase-domain-containing protein [Polychytrium aggregatum]|uniref:putative undecaprenyl diphosphate synthase-domain-containing protein n=1 Tax=Polychytrium aggregatum TaxID=110093 RepID=UPI0022FE4138|nr:putative undecaprenyl diphosphate synthase-domain-containing protein [Polychytrium aggregatum]KAI9206154.1 putative undecaprenyl diphosphate synthase-domain-containing protein [Polychytrium aggregatum]